MPVFGYDSDRADHAAFIVHGGDAARADDFSADFQLIQLGQPARPPAFQIRRPAVELKMRAVVFVAALQDLKNRARITGMDIGESSALRSAAVYHVIGAFGRSAEQVLQRAALCPVGVHFMYLHALDKRRDRRGIGAFVRRDGKHAAG